jgi:PAS domain-containing protein
MGSVKVVKGVIGWFSAGLLWQQGYAVIAAFGIFLTIASYVWFFPFLQAVEENIAGVQETIAENADDLLDLFFDNTFADLEEFSKQHLIDEENHPQFHGAFFEAREDFVSVTLYSESGGVIEEIESLNPHKHVDGVGESAELVQNSIFFRIARSDKRYVSPVFIGTNGPSVQIAMLVQNESSRVVASAELSLSLLQKVVERVPVDIGKIYLIDERGTIIADKDPQRSNSGENLRYREVVELLVRGSERVVLSEYVDENNKQVIAYGLRIQDLKWGIVVEQNKEAVFQQRNRVLLFASTFLIISIILMIVLAVIVRQLILSAARIQREREERERTIAYLPDGVVEYTGENKIIDINPAARKFLNLPKEIPKDLYISETAAPPEGLGRLWDIFFHHEGHEGGQGKTYQIIFDTPVSTKLQIVTVYVKGTGQLDEQRYLKIIHEIT